MNSFYGGPSGQSFEIEKVFTSRKALLDDLELRWTSDIGVGSYVFVSYGMPGTDKYNTNREIDSGNTLDNG
jgi:hypothetical protein